MIVKAIATADMNQVDMTTDTETALLPAERDTVTEEVQVHNLLESRENILLALQLLPLTLLPLPVPSLVPPCFLLVVAFANFQLLLQRGFLPV
jgi:hypothetical protein